jgi:hypothetical protein
MASNLTEPSYAGLVNLAVIDLQTAGPIVTPKQVDLCSDK